MFYPLSTKFESWITKLRLPWMNRVGKAMMGGFAAVLGDAMVDWATASIYEHYPEFASAQSIALIASERQLTQGLYENSAEFSDAPDSGGFAVAASESRTRITYRASLSWLRRRSHCASEWSLFSTVATLSIRRTRQRVL